MDIVNTANRTGTHPSEKTRLDALYSLQILDTAPEVRFDNYTSLISEIFDIPYCYVTFLDRDRLWIKSAHGDERGEMPRHESFCAHDLDQELLEVVDTHKDSRFRDNPMVTGDMGIRFYAGVALHSQSGEVLGRLCMLDEVPRQLSFQEGKRLMKMARLVEREIHFNEQLAQARHYLVTEALHDPVTGLPGPLLFEERLGQMARDSNGVGLVLSVHFAKFGEILSHYGSEQLDEVIHLQTQRVQALVAGHGTVSRDGFDQMLIAALDFPDHDSARAWVQTLNEQLHTPIRVCGGLRKPKVIIGAEFLQGDETHIAEAIQHAREAVYSVPESGFRFYSGTRNSLVREQDYFSARLTEALEEGRIELVYQPVFSVKTGLPHTFEALARWEDAELGQVSPAQFIPLAEADPRLSRLLSRQVMLQACKAAQAWNQGRAHPVSVNVNIAGPEFQQPDFISEVEFVLAATGLPPGQLILELTEQSFVDNVQEVSNTMFRLQERGVRCALDDFGTGYSSLSYLRNIPFHTLKIDRAFVDGIADNHATSRLLRGIVSIGKALDMTVVAEGIETTAQQKILTEAGCDGLQGYLLGRPMALTQVAELLLACQDIENTPLTLLPNPAGGAISRLLPNISTQFHGRMLECQVLLPAYLVPGWFLGAIHKIGLRRPRGWLEPSLVSPALKQGQETRH